MIKSVKSDKSKYIYIDYGIGFDGAGKWSFDNDFARNVVILAVDNHSSSHIIVIMFGCQAKGLLIILMIVAALQKSRKMMIAVIYLLTEKNLHKST